MAAECLGPIEQGLPLADIVLDLPALPHDLLQVRLLLQPVGQAIKQGQADKVFLGFPQTVEMVVNPVRKILHIVDQGTLQRRGAGMIQFSGECAEEGQVGRALQIERPARLLGLVVLLETAVLEGLEELAAPVVNPVGPAQERDDHVPAGRLVQNDLRMAGNEDLAFVGFGPFRQDLINLALPEDFQVGIRLVQKEHGLRVGRQVRQEKKRLLHSAAGRRDVQLDAGAVQVAHRNLRPLLQMLRLLDCDAEKPLHLFDESGPALGAVLLVGRNLVAQVSQNLGRPSFADADIDRSRKKPRLVGREARHGREVGDANPAGLRRDGHPSCGISPREPQGAAVERFLVGVIELQPARPLLAAADALDIDVNAYVLRLLPLRSPAHRSDGEVSPEMNRVPDRDGYEVLAVDGYAGTLLRGGLALPFLIPALYPDAPKREGLQSGGLA